VLILRAATYKTLCKDRSLPCTVTRTKEEVAVPKQILIADDGVTVRQLIRRFLESKTAYQICGEAVDGLDAVEKAKALKPDLILLDLAMPRMNGAEAATVLRDVMPEVPIVLFTMYDESVGKSLISSLGIKAVLSKPDGMGNLVACVESLLGA
jgi:DNA-binding NarL/FixJ family response regulator